MSIHRFILFFENNLFVTSVLLTVQTLVLGANSPQPLTLLLFAQHQSCITDNSLTFSFTFLFNSSSNVVIFHHEDPFISLWYQQTRWALIIHSKNKTKKIDQTLTQKTDSVTEQKGALETQTFTRNQLWKPTVRSVLIPQWRLDQVCPPSTDPKTGLIWKLEPIQWVSLCF